MGISFSDATFIPTLVVIDFEGGQRNSARLGSSRNNQALTDTVSTLAQAVGNDSTRTFPAKSSTKPLVPPYHCQITTASLLSRVPNAVGPAVAAGWDLAYTSEAVSRAD